MKSPLSLLLLLPNVLWAQFLVNPQPQTLQSAHVKCVTVYEGQPNEVPKKVRYTCYLNSGKIQFDSVYQTDQRFHTDTLKDKEQRAVSILHFKRDSLWYTEKLIYEGNNKAYTKRFIAIQKQLLLVDSIVYNERKQIVFKHLIDSGIRMSYTYHPAHHQVVLIKTETNSRQLLSTDSLIYDSLSRHIETHTLNNPKHQRIVFKRAYTNTGLPAQESTLVNGVQTELTRFSYNPQQQLMDQTVVKQDQTMERYRYTYLKTGLPEACMLEVRSPKVPGGFQLKYRKMFRYTYF